MMEIPKLAERYRQALRECTMSDGETLCCKVAAVEQMLADCEAAGAVVGAFRMLDRLSPVLSTMGIDMGMALLEELRAAERGGKAAG